MVRGGGAPFSFTWLRPVAITLRSAGASSCHSSFSLHVGLHDGSLMDCGGARAGRSSDESLRTAERAEGAVAWVRPQA